MACPVAADARPRTVAVGDLHGSDCGRVAVPERHHAVLPRAAGQALNRSGRGLERKRDFTVAELQAAGYDLQTPEGTFYLWVRSPIPTMFHVCPNARQAVLVLPGTTCASPGRFRISLTGTAEMIERSLPAFRDATSGGS